MCLSLTNLFHPSFIQKIDNAMRAAARLSLINGNYGSADVLNRNGQVVITVWHWRGAMARNVLKRISGFTFDDRTHTNELNKAAFTDITERVKLALNIYNTDILNIEIQNKKPALLNYQALALDEDYSNKAA